eukprot:tig00020531_g10025.t1
MVRRPCSTAPEISDQRSTHASAPSHMYAVAGERILSCGTRLRATLLTEHIHGQTGEPFFIGGNQSKIVPFRVDIDAPRVPRSTPSPRPSALEVALHDEMGALISS